MRERLLKQHHADEIARICTALAGLLGAAGVSRRELERRAGLPVSSVSKILTGSVHLQYRHLLLLLEELDIYPGEFFEYLYPPRDEAPGSLLMRQMRLARGYGLTQDERKERESRREEHRLRRLKALRREKAERVAGLVRALMGLNAEEEALLLEEADLDSLDEAPVEKQG